MQPKAAKKIGGMTPKKMTGGDYGEPEKITLGSDYTVTKQIDEQNGKMMICVESEMPGAKVKEEQRNMVEPETQPSEEDINKKLTEMGIDANTATPEEKESAKKALQEGGKKKRKSSKKRKSMKKKGGMKRKSMKVKA
jgi:hypothetical protein